MRPRAERKSLGGVRSSQASDQRQHSYIKREPAHRYIFKPRGSRQEIVPPQAGALEGANVRFTPENGHMRCTRDVRFVPIADITVAAARSENSSCRWAPPS